MKTALKIVLAACLIAILFKRESICEHLPLGNANQPFDPIQLVEKEIERQGREDAFRVADGTLFRWDEQLSSFVPIEESKSYSPQFVANFDPMDSAGEPIELNWKDLIDIQYELRYFSEIEMEIYAPIFPREIEALDGKEVVIKGFVIPFDENQEVLALSANPYASCFFCGKASPASVMSLYLKNQRNRYKMDDFIKFRGTLHLNSDDPNEFYYILRNAKED